MSTDTVKRLIVNSASSLATMMRQAQSDPEYRELLYKRQAIPFGSLASTLANYDQLAAQLAKADGRIEELIRERNFLQKTCAKRSDELAQVTAERDALRTCYKGLLDKGNEILAERERLVEALVRYGAHGSRCKAHRNFSRDHAADCICGFSAALANQGGAGT